MNLLSDISYLIFLYATEPIYGLPKWINKKYHNNIISHSGSNPRAFRHIKKNINSYYGIPTHSYYGNPHPSIIPIIKANYRDHISGHILSNMSNNPELKQYIEEHTLLVLKTKPDNIYFPDNLSWVFVKHIDLIKSNVRVMSQISSFDNSELVNLLAQLITSDINTYKHIFTELSRNPNPKAIELLNTNPDLINLDSIQKNPNPVIIEMLLHYMYPSLYPYTPSEQTLNIFNKMNEMTLCGHKLSFNIGLGKILSKHLEWVNWDVIGFNTSARDIIIAHWDKIIGWDSIGFNDSPGLVEFLGAHPDRIIFDSSVEPETIEKLSIETFAEYNNYLFVEKYNTRLARWLANYLS